MVSVSFVCTPNDNLASYRYRIKIPAQELSKLGFDVKIGGDDTDIAVFSKHFDYSDQITAFYLKKKGVKIVFDVCDNHFSTQHSAHYRKMIELADVVTAATTRMAKVIREQTGREAVIIDDPYEYKEEEPRLHPHNPPRLMWYGHESNLPALEDERPNLFGYDIRTIIPWSKAAMFNGFYECDVVIIPVRLDDRTATKSANRLVEGVRQGKFVVANHMPAYEQFKNMWIGDIHKGAAWAINHPDEAMLLVKEEQKYIREKFSPETIGKKWAQALS